MAEGSRGASSVSVGRPGEPAQPLNGHAAALPTVTSNGLAVYALGSGPPLLLMPYPHAVSVVGDSKMNLLVDHLSSVGRRVVTFDPPGSGRSTRQMHIGMREMLDCAEEALDLSNVAGPVDVFGHSQAGVAALAFALERPQRVRNLVLANTSSGGPAFLRAKGAIWNPSHPDCWRFALLGMLHMIWRRRAPEILMNSLIFRDSYVDRSRFTPTPVTLGDWFRPARPRDAWGRRVAWRIDYRAQLSQVQASTLVAAGRFDSQMPVDCALELTRLIPRAHLEVFERSGRLAANQLEIITRPN